MAYALFQGWGNDPLAFIPDPAIFYSANNQKLLQLATQLYTGATVPDNSVANQVDKLLGFDGADPPYDGTITSSQAPPLPMFWIAELADTTTEDTRRQRCSPITPSWSSFPLRHPAPVRKSF